MKSAARQGHGGVALSNSGSGAKRSRRVAAGSAASTAGTQLQGAERSSESEGGQPRAVLNATSSSLSEGGGVSVLEGHSASVELTDAGEKCGKEGVASHLVCSICLGPLLASHSLSCSHTYCGDCLGACLESKLECPICRTSVRTSPHPVRLLDDLVEHSVVFSPEEREVRKKRLSDFHERRAEKLARARKILTAWKAKHQHAPSPSV